VGVLEQCLQRAIARVGIVCLSLRPLGRDPVEIVWVFSITAHPEPAAEKFAPDPTRRRRAGMIRDLGHNRDVRLARDVRARDCGLPA
jgi:hypothetical protein